MYKAGEVRGERAVHRGHQTQVSDEVLIMDRSPSKKNVACRKIVIHAYEYMCYKQSSYMTTPPNHVHDSKCNHN